MEARPRSSRYALFRRDEGLHRVNVVTAWVAGGTLALVSVFSTAVAHSLPGRSSAKRANSPVSTSAGRSTGASTSSSTLPATSGAAGAPVLQPPSQAPTYSPPAVQAPVVSGGS